MKYKLEKKAFLSKKETKGDFKPKLMVVSISKADKIFVISASLFIVAGFIFLSFFSPKIMKQALFKREIGDRPLTFNENKTKVSDYSFVKASDGKEYLCLENRKKEDDISRPGPFPDFNYSDIDSYQDVVSNKIFSAEEVDKSNVSSLEKKIADDLLALDSSADQSVDEMDTAITNTIKPYRKVLSLKK